MKHKPFTPAAQSLGLQLLLTAVAAVAALLWSPVAALSVGLGGAIAAVGHLVVTGLVFQRYSAARPDGLAARMMGAEFARLVVVGACFALVFANLRDLAVVALFGSFLLVHLVPVWWLHRSPVQTEKE
jgi:ATP synthase protein I